MVYGSQVIKKRKVLESSQPSTYRSTSTRTKASRAYQKAIVRANPSTYSRRFPSPLNFPFPISWTTTHRYVGNFSLNPAIGSPTNYVFAANGLYDPDISGTGHQPMGFDQMCLFYNHYEVLSSKARMTVYNAAEAGGFNFGIKLDDNFALSTTSIESTWELPLVNFKTMPGPYCNNTGQSVMQSFYSKSFFADKAGDRETWGDASSNPTDLAYFMCILSGVTALQDVGSIPCQIIIDYVVKWHEPRDFSPS